MKLCTRLGRRLFWLQCNGSAVCQHATCHALCQATAAVWTRSALSGDFTQPRMVFPYRFFGPIYRSHFQGTGCPETSVKNIILPCVKFQRSSSCIWRSGVPPKCRHCCRTEVCVTRRFGDLCKLLKMSEWCGRGGDRKIHWKLLNVM